MSETTSEPPTPNPPQKPSFWSKLDSLLSITPFLYAVTLLLLIAFGGHAIVEIVSRINTIAFLRAEISANQALLAQKNGQPETTPSPGSEATPTPPVRPDGNKFAALLAPSKDPWKELLTAQGLLSQLTLLSSIGASVDCFTLAGMMQASILPCNRNTQIKNAAFRLDAWSDEALFLALAICSGAIGALVAGLRTIQFTLFRDLALGFASGFIVYLGMKGGKHIFLISTIDAPVLLNPYSYAFAGILVGLFTERAYNLLSSLVGELERRLLGNVAAREK